MLSVTSVILKLNLNEINRFEIQKKFRKKSEKSKKIGKFISFKI